MRGRLDGIPDKKIVNIWYSFRLSLILTSFQQQILFEMVWPINYVQLGKIQGRLSGQQKGLVVSWEPKDEKNL